MHLPGLKLNMNNNKRNGSPSCSDDEGIKETGLVRQVQVVHDMNDDRDD